MGKKFILLGTVSQNNNIKAIRNAGLQKNAVKLLFLGKTNSLQKSFTASEKGCRIPINEVLLGPFRAWVSPSTLRSRRVIKATLINTGKTIMINWHKENKKIYFNSDESYFWRNQNYKILSYNFFIGFLKKK